MLNITKIDDYLKILTHEEVKHFLVIDFQFIREKMYSKLNEEQNFRNVAKMFYIFLTTPDEVETYVEIM